MDRLQRLIRDQEGDSYIDIAIVMLVIIALLASILGIFPVLAAQQSLNNTVRQIVRAVEITGNAGSEVDDLMENLTSIKPDSLTGLTEWKDPVQKTIQLKTPFTVTATKKVPLTIIRPGFGKAIVIEISISATASGISEVYFK